MSENYDAGVQRLWGRVRNASRPNNRSRGQWHWGLIRGDLLLERQTILAREGRHTLHNVIRGDHGLPNTY